MTNLLVFREQLKKFYGKYELYITPVLKFLLALVTLIMINDTIGYMSELKNITVVLGLALICAFLPMNLTVLVAAAVTLGHLYKFSMECAVVALAVFLLLFILYFTTGYSCRTAHPIMFYFKNSICYSNINGAGWNACFCSVRSKRNDSILYDKIYDRQCFGSEYF